jgi:hypothetical protein
VTTHRPKPKRILKSANEPAINIPIHTITMAALEYEYEQQSNEEETVSLLGTTGEIGQGFYAAVATRTTRALVVLVARGIRYSSLSLSSCARTLSFLATTVTALSRFSFLLDTTMCTTNSTNMNISSLVHHQTLETLNETLPNTNAAIASANN